MTVAAPTGPTLPAPRRPWGVLALVGVVVVVVVGMAISLVTARTSSSHP
jgi:hypothetical protein